MANHDTGAQRYNKRKDKIMSNVESVSKKYGSPFSDNPDHRSDAIKKTMASKMQSKSYTTTRCGHCGKFGHSHETHKKSSLHILKPSDKKHFDDLLKYETN